MINKREYEMLAGLENKVFLKYYNIIPLLALEPITVSTCFIAR